MAYSRFHRVVEVESRFGLRIDFAAQLFPEISPVAPSDWLQQTLEVNAPLALAVNTEKARSELVIAPVLLEIFRRHDSAISFFSGVDFKVDPKDGLTGFCDYLLSRSSNRFEIVAPVLAVVEAKNEDIPGGLAQCLAEMVAAWRFNERAGNAIGAVWGTVTTGDSWRFLRLRGTEVAIDRDDERLLPLERLLGILNRIVAPPAGG